MEMQRRYLYSFLVDIEKSMMPSIAESAVSWLLLRLPTLTLFLARLPPPVPRPPPSGGVSYLAHCLHTDSLLTTAVVLLSPQS